MKLLTEKEFETAINANQKVILQFSAEWCGPCKTLSPMLEKQTEHLSDVTIYKIDIADQTSLAKKFNVRSIPKLVLFVDGSLKKEAVGMMNESKLQNFIDS